MAAGLGTSNPSGLLNWHIVGCITVPPLACSLPLLLEPPLAHHGLSWAEKMHMLLATGPGPWAKSTSTQQMRWAELTVWSPGRCRRYIMNYELWLFWSVTPSCLAGTE